MNINSRTKQMYSYVGGLICASLAMLFGLLAMTSMVARMIAGVCLIIQIWQLFDEVHIYIQKDNEHKLLCMQIKNVEISQTGNHVTLMIGFIILALQLVRIVLGDYSDSILPFSLCGLFWVFTASLKEYSRKCSDKIDSSNVSE